MFTRVYHVGYCTDDIEKAVAFFASTIDGEITGEARDQRGRPQDDLPDYR